MLLEGARYNNEDTAGPRTSCCNEDTSKHGDGSYCDNAAGRGARYWVKQVRLAAMYNIERFSESLDTKYREKRVGV